MNENERYMDPAEQALFDEEMEAAADDPLGGYVPPGDDDGGDENKDENEDESEDGGEDATEENDEASSDPDDAHDEDGNASSSEPDKTAEAVTAEGEDVSGTGEPPVKETDTKNGAESVPDEEKKVVLSEFSYISRKIRELESKINTVALSIEESADTVDRVNLSMKAVLDSIQKTETIIDNKVSGFQDETDTWGAEMKRVAENVRQACDDSRGFLSEELKREMKRSQEDIVRSTIDRVKGETAMVLTEARDDYEELLDQVVTNYKQFCKASSQHQKELKKGYFEEVTQLRRLLYVVLVVQFVVFAFLVIVLMRR